MSVRLTDLQACFQGIVPTIVATCSRDGEPNVTFLSQVFLVDERHVALSNQFFNKTRRNLAENPFAAVEVYDARTLEGWRLSLRFLRSETSGPLFDAMALRIQVIASHTGMTGVFRLLAADVFEVLAVEPVAGFLLPPDPVVDAVPSLCEVPGPLTELRGLQTVSELIARAGDLDELLNGVLAALARVFRFEHSMILVPDETGRRLVTIASHGYGDAGIGAEVEIGEGLLGTVAQRRSLVRIAGVAGELRYGRAIRDRVSEVGERARLRAEIPLPGLADAEAQLALPLVAAGRLVGVLAVESRDPLSLDEWDEAFLQILAGQIAMAVDRMEAPDEETGEAATGRPATTAAAPPGRRHTFVYYRNDDCVFVDGEYLVRNVPGKILWKMLRRHHQEGRTEFTNRELRLDPSLGLPAYRDNLETRLILLRRRLEARCPDVRMVPVRRGRFALEVACPVELVEKDSA